MFEGLYFEYPKVLSFVIVFIACEAYCKIRSRAIYFPHTQRFHQESNTHSSLLWILKYGGIVLLLLALMSPVRDEALLLDESRHYDIVLAFDSGVLAKKELLENFIENREGDAFSLLYYGETLYSSSPLSHYRKALLLMLEKMPESILAKEPPIEDVLKEAAKRLSISKNPHQFLIFINTSSVMPRAEIREMYSEIHVPIYTLTLGEKGLKKEQKGVYRLKSINELNSTLQEIDHLEPTKNESYPYAFKTYLYIYPLFMAFFMLLMYLYLRNRRAV